MKIFIKNKLKLLFKKLKKIEKILIKNKVKSCKFKKIFKKYNKIKNLKNLYSEYKNYKKIKKESKELIKEDEIKELANEEYQKSKEKIKKIKKKIKDLIIKKKNIPNKIYLEIKTGVGGEESSIFIADIFKMYLKYSEKKKWKVKIISNAKSILNGYKEIIMLIKGKNVYKNLKNESGVHRVQRFPVTENQNKIHTSTCRVAIIPYIKKKSIILNKKDIKIDTFKSSGAGGQHVNKTDSAVRIKHIPSGIFVECQNDRSQHKNKKLALKLLNIKLSNKEENKNKNEKSKKKKTLLGLGNRSEKIRTYNYPKNMIIDHRINLKLNNLNFILNGNLDKIIKELIKSENNFK